MDQVDKQQILAHIANDIKRMVAREVEEVVKKSSTKMASHNTIMSNAMANSNLVYGDFTVAKNQEVFSNDNVYKKMKNKIQYKNGTNSSTFINKGPRKTI